MREKLFDVSKLEWTILTPVAVVSNDSNVLLGRFRVLQANMTHVLVLVFCRIIDHEGDQVEGFGDKTSTT